MLNNCILNTHSKSKRRQNKVIQKLTFYWVKHMHMVFVARKTNNSIYWLNKARKQK